MPGREIYKYRVFAKSLFMYPLLSKMSWMFIHRHIVEQFGKWAYNKCSLQHSIFLKAKTKLSQKHYWGNSLPAFRNYYDPNFMELSPDTTPLRASLLDMILASNGKFTLKKQLSLSCNAYITCHAYITGILLTSCWLCFQVQFGLPQRWKL